MKNLALPTFVTNNTKCRDCTLAYWDMEQSGASIGTCFVRKVAEIIVILSLGAEYDVEDGPSVGW